MPFRIYAEGSVRWSVGPLQLFENHAKDATSCLIRLVIICVNIPILSKASVGFATGNLLIPELKGDDENNKKPVEDGRSQLTSHDDYLGRVSSERKKRVCSRKTR